MKNYENYHETNIKEKLEYEGNIIFESAITGLGASEVVIDGKVTSAVLSKKTNNNGGADKYIIGRRDEVFQGSLVVLDNQNWLVTTYPLDNTVYKKAVMTLCNETLVLTGESTETLIGHDPKTGQPVFDYQDGTTLEYPCIVTKTMVNEDLNLPINIVRDLIKVTLPYFNFKEETIELYDEKYQVKSIDKTKVINGVGIMTILGEGVQK